ncbi:7278_t:CDS:2 [Ambispora gerdemannii]|uniref:7278_t:CDS:1 n=1 Tax=Ambispora gerdemannii TaxID=144530 RepID=A0A9N9FRX6_9GLOM|nr:7278_t:CDS:2 [Ambispora gerdemannii]
MTIFSEPLGNTRVTRNRWTFKEDESLRELYRENGPKWSLIAKSHKTRSAKQCRERWLNHLSDYEPRLPTKKRSESTTCTKHLEETGQKSLSIWTAGHR